MTGGAGCEFVASAAGPLAVLRSGLAQACAEAAHVRGPRSAARWAAWLGRRVGAMLRVRRLGAARRQRRTLGLPPPARAGPGAWRAQDCRAGFDPRRCNPVGWTANVERRAVALGPPRLLPTDAQARRRVSANALAVLRHAHHVEDVAAFHAGPGERAATLARIAALGVPVRVLDADAALGERLGPELHRLMAAPAPADLDRREALSVAMRRLALRDHAARPGGWPTVSVLLATRRPDRVAAAVRAVAAQHYPRVELVLALHGNGFGRVPRLPGLDVHVVRASTLR